MMSIHEIQQLSTTAEQANAAIAVDEDDTILPSQGAEDEEEDPLQQNMASLDLADVFDIPPPTPPEESEDCSSSNQHDIDATSSSSSDSSSLFDIALHQDSRELLRLKKKEEARKASHSTGAFGQRTSSTLVDESSISSDDSSSGSDFEDEDDILLCSLHNDSFKLMRLNGIKRRATWSSARIQYNNDEDDDDDDYLSVKPLHNDSLSLLKSLVSRPSATSIFHRSLSDSDLTVAGLHNDSLAMLLGKKAKTTTSEERKATMKVFMGRLDGEQSVEGDDSSNNGSSSSILDALHSRDSLRELAWVHHAPRRSSLRD